ncbi:MAG: sigma-70 family RNA polymerase sigma factor [Pirellulaceae bacterium]
MNEKERLELSRTEILNALAKSIMSEFWDEPAAPQPSIVAVIRRAIEWAGQRRRDAITYRITLRDGHVNPFHEARLVPGDDIRVWFTREKPNGGDERIAGTVRAIMPTKHVGNSLDTFDPIEARSLDASGPFVLSASSNDEEEVVGFLISSDDIPEDLSFTEAGAESTTGDMPLALNSSSETTAEFVGDPERIRKVSSRTARPYVLLHREESLLDLGEIVRRAQGGDEHAFGEIVRRCDRYLDSVLKSSSTRAVDEVDIKQETWLAVWSELSAAEFPEPVSACFIGWLGKIAKRKAIDANRKDKAAKRGGRHELGSLGKKDIADKMCTTADKVLEANEYAATVSLALQQLKPEYQQLIQWSCFEGLPHCEIAEKLQITKQQVTNKLSQARGILRNMLPTPPRAFFETT